jgi:hypothetical protein
MQRGQERSEAGVARRRWFLSGRFRYVELPWSNLRRHHLLFPLVWHLSALPGFSQPNQLRPLRRPSAEMPICLR